MQQSRSNSYLFGGNAPYVEELYEAYLDNPGSVPDNWRTYFDNLQNVAATDGSERRDVAHAPVVESFAQRAKANAFAIKASSSDLAVARKQVHVQSLIAAYRFLGSRWADLDPLEADRAAEDPRTRAGVLRPVRVGHGHHLQRGQHLLRRRADDAAPDHAGAARNLLRHGRRRVHALHRPERKALVAGAARTRAQQAELFGRTRSPHPRPPDRRRGAGALPAHQVRRPEAFLARRRRELHRLDGRAGAARRREGRAGNRHRHGPPRAPERPGQHAGQDAGRPVRRIRPHRQGRTAGGRRQVPPGLLQRHLHARRRGAPVAVVQPLAPGDRQSGGRRQRQGAPGSPRRQDRQPGAAGAGARRRGLRGPGRGDGNAGAGADARLLHRRHGAPGHQQPDRLHHQRPARHAIDAVLHRRRQDDRGAGAACERRRPRGGRAVHAAGDGLPPALQEGRGRRHHLLSQARPQRTGHAEPDPAADVQEDRRAPGHAQGSTATSW